MRLEQQIVITHIWLTGLCATLCAVWSFGVTLLKAARPKTLLDISLMTKVNRFWPIKRAESIEECWESGFGAVANVIDACLVMPESRRPSFGDVVAQLEQACKLSDWSFATFRRLPFIDCHFVAPHCTLADAGGTSCKRPNNSKFQMNTLR